MLQVANDQCNPGGVFDAKVHLSGDKRSLSVTDDTGVPLNCVLNALGASDGTIARVLTVRPIDGELEAQWDSFDAHWKYLVDVGVQLVVEVDS